MTKRASKKFSSILCFFGTVLFILLGKPAKDGVRHGLNLSAKVLIPTLFPFFILSDYWISNYRANKKSIINKLFQRTFGINGEGISAYVGSLLFGFPLGVKIACSLFDQDRIDDKQLTVLCGFSNNPSAAFVISGVGIGMLGSVNVGLKLFLCCVISSVACGIFFRYRCCNSEVSGFNSWQKFELVDSIKRAGLTSISVTAFVTCFCTLITVISSFIRNKKLMAIISSLLEVCTAADLIVRLNSPIKIPLLAFALGFSGLSVHLQAFSLMPKEASKRKYLAMKFTQGIICMFLSHIIV